MKYLIDTHMHTTASGHAYNTIEEMLEQAAERGLEIAGITEHAPKMPGTCQLFYFHNLKAINKDYLSNKFGLEVLFGAELNIMNENGKTDMDMDGLKQLDVAIASLHVPCIAPASIEKNTKAVIEAIKNPYVDIIGHPDDSRYLLEYEKIVKTAKEYGKLLEVNNSSLKPDSFRAGAKENYKVMLKLCREYGQPIIVNSDAHYRTLVGAHEYAEQLFTEINFPEELILNGQPDTFRKYILKYRKKRLAF